MSAPPLATPQQTPGPPSSAPGRRSAPAALRRAFWVGFWLLVVGLVGVNAWWFWEARPLPDLPMISRWMSRGWYNDAEAALRAHLKRSPHEPEARWMLARVLAARNDMAGSLEQLRQVPFWSAHKPEALMRQGQLAMSLYRAAEAEAAWKACVAGDPMHPAPPQAFTQAINELVQLDKWEGRNDEARDLLWSAYQLTEPAAHAQILLMSVWIGLLKNDPAEAAQKLQRFVEAEPGNLEARRALARAEVELGQPAEATKQMEACFKLRPRDPLVWRDWLWILTRRGDRPALAQALDEMPPQLEQFAESWMARGLERENAGDLDAAARAYREAQQLKPFEEDGYYKLAMVEKRLGHAQQAEAHLARQRSLHKAREELRATYDAYLDASRDAAAHKAELSPLTERMAAGCDALGWAREARAWRVLAAAN